MKRHILLIGPKKTGTTAIYKSISKLALTEHELLPKESNWLIRFGVDKLVKSRKAVIDISPEYYTSFRALAMCNILAKRNIEHVVIVLSRDRKERRLSHINYMREKLLIDESFTDGEWENIFLSELNIWENFYNLKVNVMNVAECLDFLEEELGREIRRDLRENTGGFSVRCVSIYKIAYKLASLMRKNSFGVYLVEKFSPLIKSFLYGKKKPEVERVAGAQDQLYEFVENTIPLNK